jgi:hypothetical protein
MTHAPWPHLQRVPPAAIVSLAAVLFAISPACARQISISSTLKDPQNVRTFNLTEWEIDAAASYPNPFDVDQVAVDAIFTSADGDSFTVPAFWDEPPTELELPGAGESHGEWEVRFSPPRAGSWHVQAKVRDHAGTFTSPSTPFDVKPGNSPGFLRAPPAGTNYFHQDASKPLFLIGVDLCWPGRAQLAGFDHYFAEFAAVGGNFTRVWMSQPRLLENKKTTLGRYDPNSAAYYDGMLDSAQHHGLRVMLTIDDYRKLAQHDFFGHTDWESSPYNAANGGPLKHPSDFFTNALCIKLYRQKLRYLVARYSAYTSLGFWELWNEQDELPQPGAPHEWMAQMCQYLRQIDPVAHPITTSYASNAQADVWRLPEIGLTQRHFYGEGDIEDFVPRVMQDAASHREFNKPHLIGEMGITWKAADIKFDPAGNGTTIHNASWAGLMCGDAGTPMNWWWDNYIEPTHLWHIYEGIARFAAAIDWSRHWQPLEIPPPVIDSAEPPTFSDINLIATGPWGKLSDQPILIRANGEANLSLPTFIYGPQKASMGQFLSLNIDLPHAGDLILHVDRVSVKAQINVMVDGRNESTFAFDASPGAPDHQSTTQLSSNPLIYQAVINKDYPTPLSAGPHTLLLSNTDGDWLSLRSITFTNARSSRIADLHALGLRDSASGALMAWLCDTKSTWKSDLDGIKPRTFSHVHLQLPAISNHSNYTVQWWDTRAGTVFKTETATSTGRWIALTVPDFLSDVAVRVESD